MTFIETPLAGAFIVDLSPARDERGFFARSFGAREFADRGLTAGMQECSVSFNAMEGTLRGLHFQADPQAEDKLVRCTAGAIFDVIVDLRAGSESHHRWFGLELSAENRRSLFVPKGFAHGFITLREATEVFYMISAPYAPRICPGSSLERSGFRHHLADRAACHVDSGRVVPAARCLDARLNAARRVLVTGAAGFIGRASLGPLAERGYEVHAVVSGARTVGAVHVHNADLLDPQSTERLVLAVRPSHLLHFAWVAAPGVYASSALNYRWLAASEYLLECFAQSGGVRAVMAGSCAEYDSARVEVCDERSSPLATESGGPATPYAECKIAMQRSLERFAPAHRLSAAWGRVFFQYGPYEHPQRLVASVILDLLNGREALCTHGRQIRSFLHVSDVGAAFAALLDQQVEGPVNIGGGERISIADLLRMLAAQIGRSDLLKLGAREVPAAEPAILLPDTRRLRQEVGFVPRISLEAGLLETIDWWRKRTRVS